MVVVSDEICLDVEVAAKVVNNRRSRCEGKGRRVDAPGMLGPQSAEDEDRDIQYEKKQRQKFFFA